MSFQAISSHLGRSALKIGVVHRRRSQQPQTGEKAPPHTEGNATFRFFLFVFRLLPSPSFSSFEDALDVRRRVIGTLRFPGDSSARTPLDCVADHLAPSTCS